MAQEENPRVELDRLETYRLIAIGIAITLSILGGWLESDLLDIPRALAWGAAAVCCGLQARVLRRMGESPYPAYALGVCMLLLGVWALL